MKNLFIFFFLMNSLALSAQVTPNIMRRAFTGESSVAFPRLNNAKLVERFYQLYEYNMVWMHAEDSGLKMELLDLLSTAEAYGLDERDYQFAFIQNLKISQDPISPMDSIFADLKLTDAALHFLSEIKNGNKAPALSYTGINYEPFNMPQVMILAAACSKHSLENLIQQTEPISKEYLNAKKLLAHFNKVMLDKKFAEVKITSSLVSQTNHSLLVKLFQLGIVDSIYAIDNKTLVKKIQQAQNMLDVLNDGVLRKTTLTALNITLSQRREELKTAMNNIRYLAGFRENGNLAMLNIPSANLYIYIADSIALYSKVIVGKPATPTPTLSSRITEVIVYPYWHVPFKIATKEMLPLIKQNVGYLAANDLQVLSKSGKILDPDRINWSALSSSYFPYTLRQSTGCDNALGVLKFNFFSPFSVYLHDTPGKGLFYLNKRYFSHGCMRVEKPVEFSQILLKEKASDIDTLISQCLKEQKPKTIRLSESLPLVVLYSTAWYTEKGEIRFYDDVYHKLPAGKNPVAKF